MSVLSMVVLASVGTLPQESDANRTDLSLISSSIVVSGSYNVAFRSVTVPVSPGLADDEEWKERIPAGQIHIADFGGEATRFMSLPGTLEEFFASGSDEVPAWISSTDSLDVWSDPLISAEVRRGEGGAVRSLRLKTPYGGVDLNVPNTQILAQSIGDMPAIREAPFLMRPLLTGRSGYEYYSQCDWAPNDVAWPDCNGFVVADDGFAFQFIITNADTGLPVVAAYSSTGGMTEIVTVFEYPVDLGGGGRLVPVMSFPHELPPPT